MTKEFPTAVAAASGMVSNPQKKEEDSDMLAVSKNVAPTERDLQNNLARVVRRTVHRSSFLRLMKRLGIQKIRARRMWLGNSGMTVGGLFAVAAMARVSPVDLMRDAEGN